MNYAIHTLAKEIIQLTYFNEDASITGTLILESAIAEIEEAIKILQESQSNEEVK